RFAANFLQIPPHGGHPCLRLMVTTAFTIRDFNPRDNAHAGRTCKKSLKSQDIRDFFSKFMFILGHLEEKKIVLYFFP
ncbi:hypothetical protein, partial [Brevibacillus reuszeri]|uniref:hypothetical protein n=1 Tax=Brevibacillus reuszeri TaxID=54915 RepID=UPI001F40A3CF